MEAGSDEIIDRNKIDQLLEDMTLFLSEDEDPVAPTVEQLEELEREGVVRVDPPLRRLTLSYRSKEANDIMQRIDDHRPELTARGRPRWKVEATCGQSAPPTADQIVQLLQPHLAWAVNTDVLLRFQQEQSSANNSTVS